MLVKRKSKIVDRILVVNDDREVTEFLCAVHNFNNTGYKETVRWTGPDREMRDMMTFHQLVAADTKVQTTLDGWASA